MPDELEDPTLTEETESTAQDSIDQELVPQALDNPSTEDIDSELISKDTLEPKEPEQRIKKLSQDFFQKPEEPQNPELAEDETDELAAKAATSEFSEIPSFGEHLDLSKVPEAKPATEDLEFPPNPFAEDQTTADAESSNSQAKSGNKGPGQLPTPDVPEDL